ncbi:hypothetical protein [Sinorhizobium meliloti]|uniref:hypothetical protein n=1 Tax=Rhizobium meliloti TaxID=382 RepID=UPI000B4A3F29|nr:hypothetical protein [Sinorhizobium meliloti]MDX0986046.1 hypothetical protein [Sinorhizobium medicae]ASQ14953.1 hypothetical protein CDO22_33975 [Sinorhizobium meliloti]MDX1066804.1 hypothetical protein [Sinorhizobium medicae]MQU69494.1 hypothetical protein [Sinorhizobium meliloti]MQU81275.1 hypothetical protein [Sinorhizobium meliloti]
MAAMVGTNHKPEKNVSGRKKRFRKSVMIRNFGPGRGRRKVRRAVGRRASIHFVLGMIMMGVVLIVVAALTPWLLDRLLE